MKVFLKKLKENALLPVRGSAFAAGYDLCACIENPMLVAPHETVKIGTGISAAIPVGWFGAVFARSGLACKEGLRPANCVGVVDSDYRGEIIVAVHNDSSEKRCSAPGERIAQLVILPFLDTEFAWAEDLPETERGESGFGSTGK